MKTRKTWTSALVLLVLLVDPMPSRAADPSQKWRTIVTPHFYVHYYISSRHDEREVAQQVARAAELAHAKLAPAMRHVPSSRTHVVVTDDTDGANGSAQIVPMNIIRVFVTGPSSLGALNDYDEWLYGLILHEYTHILHIDTIHGLAKLVNLVMGKTWAPNMIQPRWVVEGMAVYFETMRSSGGRGRSSVYDMYLRAAVLEGKLLEIDQISSFTRYYPRGTVAYLYGARFIKYIADRFGEDKLAEISHDYGGTVVPYGINRTVKHVLGHDYVELYADFKEHMRRRYALQREAAERRGLTAFRKITDYGESCGSPRFSSDGKEVVFVDNDGRSHAAVKILDVQGGKIEKQFDSYGGSGIDFTPDGEHLVYGQQNIWRTFYDYQDIYVRHRRSGRVRQLTSGLRARDPAVSPDGRQVAFVTNELGTMSLAVIPFEGGAHRVLYRGSKGDQVFSPKWSPDGRFLVYSRWKLGGYRDIYMLELASGAVRQITSDRALDTDPVFSPDGRRIYFSSDRTGIYNIYCHELQTGEVRQVSNVLGGAFLPTISPDERTAYYVGFSAKGYDLHAMELNPQRYPPALPYVNDRPAPVIPPEKPEYPERAYSPLPTLYPRAWWVSVGNDAFGTTLSFEIRGGDVAGHHGYALVTNIGTAKGHASYGISYGYHRLWPSLSLDTSRFEGPRGGVVIDGEKRTYIEENYGFGAGLSLPVLRVSNHSGNISFGYRLNWFRDADETRVLVLPGDLSPRMPEVGILAGLTLGLSYRSVERYDRSVSNERGRAVYLGLRVDQPALGSDYESTQVTYSWTEYVDLPWADDHVLALRLGGGIAAGNLSRRGIFFLGGFPEQDVLRSLFDPLARVGGVYLRGYPPGKVYGNQFHLLNVEYRMPLLDIEKGVLSLPFYLTHIHAAAFVDYGYAFFDDPQLDDFKVGVGAELLFEMVLGYYQGTTLRVGYARGLREGGENQYHILLGYPF